MTLAQKFEELGRQKGHQEGREEGRLEGERMVLLKQLQLKFGPLPADGARRLTGADEATLEVVATRILTAGTLAEVFDDLP